MNTAMLSTDARDDRAQPSKPLNVRRCDVAGLIGLLAAATSIRMYAIGRWSFWLDETYQYHYSVERIGDLPTILRGWDGLLFYVYTHVVVDLGLESAGSMRASVAIVGVAAVGATWYLARIQFGATAAWIAASLAAIWPRLVEYSQEFRYVTSSTLLSALVLIFLLDAVRRNQPVSWALFVVATCLNLSNHANAVLGVGASALVGVWLGVERLVPRLRTRSTESGLADAGHTVRSMLISFGVAGSGLLALLLMYSRVRYDPLPTEDRLELSAETVRQLFGDLIGIGGGWKLALSAVFVVAGLTRACQRTWREGAVWIIWLGSPLVALTTRDGSSQFLNSPRYLLFLAVPWVVLLAAGATWAIEVGVPMVRRPAARDAGRVALGSLATFGLVVLIVTAANATRTRYSTNPKQIPIDLDFAYGAVAQDPRSGDVVLQMNGVAGWSVYWYTFYNSYYLRPEARAPQLTYVPVTASSGSLLTGLRSGSGRLSIMIIVQDGDQAALAARATSFATECRQNICVLTPVGPAAGSLSAGLDAWFAQVLPIDTSIPPGALATSASN